MKFTSGKYLKVTTERELNPSSFFIYFQPIKNNEGSLHKFITQCCKRKKKQQNEILDRCDSYRSPYISFHAFTWDWPKTELRPASLRVGR